MAKKSTKPAKQEEVEDQDEEGTDTEAEEGDEEGTETETGTTEAKKKTYETMVVGVSKARKPLREQLEKAAATLGCKPTDLVWHAIEQVLKNPPKVAPAGSATNVGSAAGFWIVPLLDNKGKANGIKITEVSSRGEVANGRTFFRFKKGDAKERARAKAQAVRSAQADASMIGYKGDIDIEELEGAETANA